MQTVTAKARVSAALGTAVFLFVAPGTFAVFIPWWITRWRMQASYPGVTALRAIGILFISAGSIVVLDAFFRFALQGIGTPAPVFPTRRLVISGSYRFVRNPMYIAVVSIIFGQALLFGNILLFIYGLCFWLPTHLFVRFYEEPTLRRTFPEGYAAFTAHVPRWIPRLTPWQGCDR
jgi:protein-S-isoprenylcysteine O-methyltransferase Ste14